jgi:carbonic anhydrase
MSSPDEGSGAKASRRRAIVGASIGLACCVVVMVAVLARGGERGSNGRAELEGVFGGAPQIELADKNSELFPSSQSARSAARHMETAAALLAGTVGKGDTAELDSVKPLLDAHGTLNLAAVTEAMGTKLAGAKGAPAAGGTITLHGVPTQVTLTLPEDVTIDAKMVKQAQEAGKTTELVTSQSVTASGLGWAYSGANTQPKDWQYIKEDWKTCGGLKQSPIDIVPSKAKGGEDLPPVSWECGGNPCAPSDPTVAPPASDSVKIAYNGRYIELTDFAADKAPKLKSTGDLLQSIRLHTPSENAIDGQYFDLEVQLLHGESPDKIQTIVSIFFQSGGGETTPSWLEDIADVISPCHLSVVRTECQISNVPHHLTTEFSFAAVALSAEAQMLHHYEYNGSLTTPPCTEGIKWLVARAPQLMNQVDWTSIAALQGKNNRPRQPRNGRDVKWV